MKGLYQPDVERETEDIVMRLGQEDEITERRWKQIDNVIRRLKGLEPRGDVD